MNITASQLSSISDNKKTTTLGSVEHISKFQMKPEKESQNIRTFTLLHTMSWARSMNSFDLQSNGISQKLQGIAKIYNDTFHRCVYSAVNFQTKNGTSDQKGRKKT